MIMFYQEIAALAVLARNRACSLADALTLTVNIRKNSARQSAPHVTPVFHDLTHAMALLPQWRKPAI
ncbi:hypothetical protein [Komagataeibacter sp. NFXK3]